MKLQNKIIISFVIAILIAFFPLVFILQTEVKESNKVQIESEISNLVASKSNEIDLWLKIRINEIRMIQEIDAIKEMDMPKVIEFVDQLNGSDNISDKLSDETFAIGTTDGLGYLSKDFYIDVSQREYFQEVLKTDKEYIISDPVFSRSDQSPIFLLSAPVRSNNETIGFINGSVSLESITNIVDKISTYDSTSWIMNTESDIYSSDEPSILEVISKSDLERINKMFETNKSGHFVIDDEDKSVTLFYHSIESSEDWILCTMVSNDTINSHTSDQLFIIIQMSLIFIVIAIILAVLLSNSIVKPINNLKDHMSNISKGPLKPYDTEVSGKEVNELKDYYNNMLKDLEFMMDKLKLSETQKREAELRSLQAQINPHFLYNTLDTLQWKALEQDNFYVADMIGILSGYFRIVLSSGDDLIPIHKEIEHTLNYLKIQKIRYEDILNYTIDVDDSISNILLPKLIIQPLVENSIYHGLKLKDNPGNINITVEQLNNKLRIIVFDDGMGIKSDQLHLIKDNLLNSIESDHYGLYNINERLKLYYGEDYHLQLDSVYKEYTKITISIPLDEEEHDVSITDR